MEFDKVIDNIKETAATVGKKTGIAVDAVKTKIDVIAKENTLESKFKTLGKLYYESLKNDGDFTTEIGNAVSEINAISEGIESLRKELLSTKNKSACPACGAIITNDSLFCNKCGEKLVYENKDFAEEQLNDKEIQTEEQAPNEE